MHALCMAQVINENYYQKFSIDCKNDQKDIKKKSSMKMHKTFMPVSISYLTYSFQLYFTQWLKSYKKIRKTCFISRITTHSS